MPQAAEPFFTALFTALLIGTWPSLRALARLAGFVIETWSRVGLRYEE